MESLEPLEVAMDFIKRINAGDVDALCELMTEQHVFQDALGKRFVGRETMRQGWKAYFKGGWGSGTGRIDNQIALLVNSKTNTRVSVAVLTYLDGSHSYGKETLRGIFKRLLRGLHP